MNALEKLGYVKTEEENGEVVYVKDNIAFNEVIIIHHQEKEFCKSLNYDEPDYISLEEILAIMQILGLAEVNNA